METGLTPSSRETSLIETEIYDSSSVQKSSQEKQQLDYVHSPPSSDCNWTSMRRPCSHVNTDNRQWCQVEQERKERRKHSRCSTPCWRIVLRFFPPCETTTHPKHTTRYTVTLTAWCLWTLVCLAGQHTPTHNPLHSLSRDLDVTCTVV